MNDVLHAIFLGILQGITEFLPISSSAHLILCPKLLGWNDFGLLFDILIHFGSVFAIIYYFLKNSKADPSLKAQPIKILWLIILATIPVGLAGLMLQKYIEIYLRNTIVLAITNIIFGSLLGLAYYRSQKYSPNLNKLLDLKCTHAWWIGLAQTLALIPGVSRSGVTLTACLLLGCDLLMASRFTFLLAIPVILAASSKTLLSLWIESSSRVVFTNWDLTYSTLTIGFVSSLISSFIFVKLFFKYIKQLGLWPFVIYRISLGFGLLLLQ